MTLATLSDDAWHALRDRLALATLSRKYTLESAQRTIEQILMEANVLPASKTAPHSVLVAMRTQAEVDQIGRHLVLRQFNKMTGENACDERVLDLDVKLEEHQ